MAVNSASGGFVDFQAKIDPQDLAALYRAAKAAEGAIQVELRRTVKAAAKPVADGVKSAASFSTRIPGAVKTKVSFASKGAGVSVYVDSKAAPEAAPINNRGKGGTFRHPVYGNRDVWVPQAADPFFAEGVREGLAQTDALLGLMFTRLGATLGYH